VHDLVFDLKRTLEKTAKFEPIGFLSASARFLLSWLAEGIKICIQAKSEAVCGGHFWHFLCCSELA
jgi:hypothetical protein